MKAEKVVLKATNKLSNRTKGTTADLVINSDSALVFQNLDKVNGFVTVVKAGTQWFLVVADEEQGKLPFIPVFKSKTTKTGETVDNKKVRRKANEFVKVLRTNDNGWFNAFNLVEADKTQLGTAEEVVTVGETIAKQVEWTKIYQLVPNFI
jgi:hypothetical protein